MNIKMKKPYEDFAKRLKESRIRLGINQNELAKRTGLTAAAISQFESGKHLPLAANLQKVAEVLQVSTDELLDKKQIKNEYELLNKMIELLESIDDKLFTIKNSIE